MPSHLAHFLRTTNTYCTSSTLKDATLDGLVYLLTGNAVRQRLLFEYAIGHLIDQDNAAAKAHESALLPSDAWVLFIAKDQDSMQQALDQEWTDIGYETGLETDSGDPNGGPGWRERRKWMQRIRMCYTSTEPHLRAFLASFHSSQSNNILSLMEGATTVPPTLIIVHDLLGIVGDKVSTIARTMAMLTDAVRFVNKTATADATRNNSQCHVLVTLPNVLAPYSLVTPDIDMSVSELHDGQRQDDAAGTISIGAWRALEYWCDWVVHVDVGLNEQDNEQDERSEEDSYRLVVAPSQSYRLNNRCSETVSIRYKYDGGNGSNQGGRLVLLNIDDYTGNSDGGIGGR